MTEKERKPPVFLLGSQRSGTTMLRLMLNNHPNLAIPHETAFITIYYDKLKGYGDLADKENVRRLLEDVGRHPLVQRGKLIEEPSRVLEQPISSYREFVEAIFRAYAESLGKPRWGDKTPFYTPHIDTLYRLFPDAYFVHLVRDGRDVVLSQKTIEWMSGNLPKLVSDWRWKTTIAHKVGSAIGERFLELRYEDLVRRPEEGLRRVCEFIGESFDPAMLSYSESAEGVVPGESLQWHRKSVRPPDPSQLEKWKTDMSRSERIIFEQLAGDTLDLFGYEREHLEPTISSRALKVYYALWKRN